MPTSRSRVVLAVLAALAAVGLVAIALPDHHDRPAAVGTEGPDRTELHRDEPLAAGDVPTTTEEGEEPVATSGATTTTTTRASGPSSTTTAQPAPTTTTPAPAPRSLVGRIAYLSSDPVSDSLWSVRPDGSDRRQEVACPVPPLFGNGLDVAPDGRSVARVCGSASDRGMADLVVQDIATGAIRTLRSAGAFEVMSPRFSPDGRTVAVRRAFGVHDLELIDLATGAIRSVSPSLPSNGTIPTWSPDGRQVLLGDGIVVDVATGHAIDLEPLVRDPNVDGSISLSWAPSGLVYASVGYMDGPQGLYDWKVLAPATGEVRLLAHALAIVDLPAYLPDGRLVLSLSTTGMDVTGPDGTAPHRLPGVPWGVARAAARPVAGLPTTG